MVENIRHKYANTHSNAAYLRQIGEDIKIDKGAPLKVRKNNRELVKKFSSLTNRNVVANSGVTTISLEMFKGRAQGKIYPDDSKKLYKNINNKHAGMWIKAKPNGELEKLGYIKLLNDGFYLKTFTEPKMDTSENPKP